MAHSLPEWAAIAGQLGVTICSLGMAVGSLWRAWLLHIDRREVLVKALENTDSADKAKVIEAWASVERSTRAGLPHKHK